MSRPMIAILVISTFMTAPAFAYTRPLTPEVANLRKKLPTPNNTLVKKKSLARVRKYRAQIISFVPQWKPQAQFTFYPGSLKKNIQRIAKEFGWHDVVWTPSYDYTWVGKTHFNYRSKEH